MKRHLPGLNQGSQSCIPDGFYLVRVRRAQHRWERQKPYYDIQLAIVEPEQFVNRSISGRINCTKKALWKLSWFLRDFGYDSELIENDELDESALVKLHGIVKISHAVVNGTSLLNLDGFAPSARWREFSTSGQNRREVAS